MRRTGRSATFQLSCYLTLALAAVCLGFAEVFFLKWMPWYLGFLGVLFFLAWKFEGRWQLSEQGANYVGVVIAFGMFGWILIQLPRNEEDLLAAGVPWPAGLLPHLGPLLMILTAVKLFRPKTVADFWVLQILGVMMITLASVLAGEVDHGIWIVLYFVSLVWCLALFQQMQPVWVGLSEERRRQAPLFPTDDARAGGSGLPARLGEFPRALAWTLGVVCLGGALFVVAPRQANVNWVPHKLSAAYQGRVTAGLEAGMDLNRTGKIELSEEVAFEVTPRDSEGKVVSLPADVYWRGETLDFYQNGRWFRGVELRREESDGLSPETLRSKKPGHPEQPPVDMGTGKTHLSIHVLPRMQGQLVLAEPIDRQLEVGRAPMADGGPMQTHLFEYCKDADTIEWPKLRPKSYLYGQVVDFAASAKRQPASTLQPRYLEKYFEQSPPVELLDWSRALLARQESLTAEEKTLNAEARIPEKHRAKVALTICQHFAGSGEYLYSLNLRRSDTLKDVNVDFLLNVKEGHCERYASGLALTLRGLGIPTRVVHGFHGWENSENNTAIVRFNHAHSWVQALVPTADGKGNEWLLLDPTPSQEATPDRWQQFCDWLDFGLGEMRTAFRTFVLDYGSDQQKARLRGWWAKLKSNAGPAMGIGVALLVVWFGRKPLMRWRAARQTARLEYVKLPWLADALAIVAKKTGMTPTANQTLLEFASQLRVAAVAMSPAFDALTGLANRVRFGQQPLSDDDAREIAINVDRLRIVQSVVGAGSPP